MRRVSGFEGGGTKSNVVLFGVLGVHSGLVYDVGCSTLSRQWAFLLFPAIASVWFSVGVTIDYLPFMGFYSFLLIIRLRSFCICDDVSVLVTDCCVS